MCGRQMWFYSKYSDVMVNNTTNFCLLTNFIRFAGELLQLNFISVCYMTLFLLH